MPFLDIVLPEFGYFAVFFCIPVLFLSLSLKIALWGQILRLRHIPGQYRHINFSLEAFHRLFSFSGCGEVIEHINN